MSVQRTNLHQLREKLAGEFLALMNQGEIVMKDGEPLIDADGKLVIKRPSPAMLNVIRQFLKDNGIDRDPIEAPTGRESFTKDLPFEEDSQVAFNETKQLEAPDPSEF